eukprot:853235-Amphidinium_carterae.1
MFADPVRFFTDFFQWLGIPNHPLSYYHENFQAAGRRRVHKALTDEDYDRYHSQALAVECKRRLEHLAGRRFAWK